MDCVVFGVDDGRDAVLERPEETGNPEETGKGRRCKMTIETTPRLPPRLVSRHQSL
jgi:hypothetical protein